MKFSVIVPTFQEEKWIRACLESIRNQDFPRNEFEIIVSDANSTDSTGKIAKELADKVLTTVTRGIAHGRNVGAKSASGEFLLFVDADVQLDPTFLKECQPSLVSPGCVAVTGIPRPMDGTSFHKLIYKATYWTVRLFHFFGLSYFPGICVAYRKDAFDKVGGFREDFGIVEDLDLSRRISFMGSCVMNGKATAQVSTRRLHKHAFSTIAFHLYNHARYLLTGKAARQYPKIEEINSWLDICRINSSNRKG